MNDVIKHKIKHNAHRALVSVKWVIFSILFGGIVGLRHGILLLPDICHRTAWTESVAFISAPCRGTDHCRCLPSAAGRKRYRDQSGHLCHPLG